MKFLSVNSPLQRYVMVPLTLIVSGLTGGCANRVHSDDLASLDTPYAQRDGDNRDMASQALRSIEHFEFKPIEDMPGVPVKIQEFAVHGLEAKQSLAALLADAKNQNLDASQVARSWFLIKMHIAMNGVDSKDIKEKYIALVKSEDYKLFKNSNIYVGLTSSEESDFRLAINIIEAIAKGDAEVVPESVFDQKRDRFFQELQKPPSEETPAGAPPPAQYAGKNPKKVV